MKTCADPEFFQRGTNFDNFLFIYFTLFYSFIYVSIYLFIITIIINLIIIIIIYIFDFRKEDTNTTKSGPSSARQRKRH